MCWSAARSAATRGLPLAANYVVTSRRSRAHARPAALGQRAERDRESASSRATVWSDRVNAFDLRVAKVLRFGRTRTNVGVDIYNLINSSAVLTYNRRSTLVARWLVPTSVLSARASRRSARRSISERHRIIAPRSDILSEHGAMTARLVGAIAADREVRRVRERRRADRAASALGPLHLAPVAADERLPALGSSAMPARASAAFTRGYVGEPALIEIARRGLGLRHAAWRTTHGAEAQAFAARARASSRPRCESPSLMWRSLTAPTARGEATSSHVAG